MLWTGSRRVGHSQFVDENGVTIENLDCNFYESTTKDDIFKFPSQMTAYVSDTRIVWRNSIPGIFKIGLQYDVQKFELTHLRKSPT